MSNANATMATLWNDEKEVMFSCQGESKMECCNRIWLLLQDLCSSQKYDWCLPQEEFDFLCINQMATFTLSGASRNQSYYALFLSAQSKEHEHGEVEWKQYVNGDWNDEAMLSPFSPAKKEKGPSFSATVHSSLSPDGGMHRLLYHDISIDCPEETNGSFQASLTLLIFVTEYFFVDMDDAFLINSENVSLASISNELIDIEQPAFVSPQHVMATKVDMEGICNDSFQYKVATKLHVRYPPLTKSGFVNVAFPAPLIISGELQSKHETYTLRYNEITWQPPIHVQVATGYEGDYYWVGLVTILTSLVGALILLRDLAKVSKWK